MSLVLTSALCSVQGRRWGKQKATKSVTTSHGFLRKDAAPHHVSGSPEGFQANLKEPLQSFWGNAGKRNYQEGCVGVRIVVG